MFDMAWLYMKVASETTIDFNTAQYKDPINLAMIYEQLFKTEFVGIEVNY